MSFNSAQPQTPIEHLPESGGERTKSAIFLEQAVLASSVKAQLFGIDVAPRIGKFKLERLLGSGGMGVVYTAYDTELARKVAIKMVRAELATDDRGRARVIREAQSMAKLSHPNVVQIYEIGDYDGQIFVAMEYVEGPTLRQWLNQQTRTWPEVLAKFIEAGQGLAAAHRKGLVHLDFKPDNVVIDEHGHARVLDFGLSRMVATDVLTTALEAAIHPVPGDHPRVGATSIRLGTPGYIAPERLSGHADAKSDQYSFCCALFESIVGELPRQPNPCALNKRQRAAMPAGLGKIIFRGLAGAPDQRWPTMDVLLPLLAKQQTRARVQGKPIALAWGLGVCVSLVNMVLNGTYEASLERCHLPDEPSTVKTDGRSWIPVKSPILSREQTPTDDRKDDLSSAPESAGSAHELMEGDKATKVRRQPKSSTNRHSPPARTEVQNPFGGRQAASPPNSQKGTAPPNRPSVQESLPPRELKNPFFTDKSARPR